jgi:hypothetical protein
MADENLIEISIDDIELGFDDDGMPKATPVAKAPPKAETKTATPAKKAEPTVSEADLAAERMRAQRAQAEAEAAQAALKAEREARLKVQDAYEQRTEQAARAHWVQINTEAEQIAGAIALAKSEQDAAERALQSAIDAGDAQAQAEAARRISRNESQITMLEQGHAAAKAEIEKTRRAFQEADRARKDEPAPETKKPAQAEEPKKPATPDEWISQFPRKLAGWLNEHKDYVTDRSKHEQFLAFANEWAADYGQQAIYTPSFVQALADKFDPKEPEKTREDEMAEAEDQIEEIEEKPAPRRSAPAAPVSRSTPATPSGSNAIKLTTEQHAIAPDLYSKYEDLSPEVQAKFKQWTPTAARYQYHQDLKRAQADGKYLPRG